MRVGVMLHSVHQGCAWDYSYLSNSIEEVARLVFDLKNRGYEFCFASEWPTKQKGNNVFITFDDGYLDNWTTLFPWMLENRVKFTVFVNKDFIDESNAVRPASFGIPGYLNAAEIKAMSESGFVDIQSHSCTHTWYETGPKIIDIFTNESKGKYPWILWNAFPHKKPEWITYSDSSLDGMPVFENDRSLRALRYLVPDDVLLDLHVRIRSGYTVDQINNYFVKNCIAHCRYETMDEAFVRYTQEIDENNNFIERITGRRPTVLCWPGGAFNAISSAVSNSLGMLTTTQTGYGNEDGYIHRISPTNYYGKDRWPWKNQALTFSYYLARFRFKSYAFKTRKLFVSLVSS